MNAKLQFPARRFFGSGKTLSGFAPINKSSIQGRLPKIPQHPLLIKDRCVKPVAFRFETKFAFYVTMSGRAHRGAVKELSMGESQIGITDCSVYGYCILQMFFQSMRVKQHSFPPATWFRVAFIKRTTLETNVKSGVD